MKIVLRNEICDKLEDIVKDFKVSKHCIGCEGLDINNPNPYHHPSIEITQRCQHNCLFCYSRLVNVKEGIYGIDPKNPDTKNYTALTISQYGEPLLYPEKVKRAIEFTKSLNLRCDLQTNGVNLNEELIGEFKDLGLDILMVSLSASKLETHKRITGSKTFEKVLENIKLASKYLYTIVRSVYIPGFNREELIELSEILSRETDVKEIMVHHLIVHRENRDRLKHVCNLENVGKIKDLLLLVDEMRRRAPNLKVTVKGCLIVNLKGLDGYLLNSMTLDCFSEVPMIKREYYPFF
ncbi:MAG TPA: radical SAM protein [Methanothermococcus okinawensis]|uniref:Radical SAM protein n=1 Tax=Methanothermococcus okinawensis TaxID=155863 RepID=A0A832ZJU3_9EURY|nr:radical SAM protein [Methanothermococcus okinawensis]